MVSKTKRRPLVQIKWLDGSACCVLAHGECRHHCCQGVAVPRLLASASPPHRTCARHTPHLPGSCGASRESSTRTLALCCCRHASGRPVRVVAGWCSPPSAQRHLKSERLVGHTLTRIMSIQFVREGFDVIVLSAALLLGCKICSTSGTER